MLGYAKHDTMISVNFRRRFCLNNFSTMPVHTILLFRTHIIILSNLRNNRVMFTLSTRQLSDVFARIKRKHCLSTLDSAPVTRRGEILAYID